MSDQDASIIRLKRIVPPEQITLDATEYYTLLSFLGDYIVNSMKRAETDPDFSHYEQTGLDYLKALHKKLLPYQIRGHVELRLLESGETPQ